MPDSKMIERQRVEPIAAAGLAEYRIGHSDLRSLPFILHRRRRVLWLFWSKWRPEGYFQTEAEALAAITTAQDYPKYYRLTHASRASISRIKAPEDKP